MSRQSSSTLQSVVVVLGVLAAFCLMVEWQVLGIILMTAAIVVGVAMRRESRAAAAKRDSEPWDLVGAVPVARPTSFWSGARRPVPPGVEIRGARGISMNGRDVLGLATTNAARGDETYVMTRTRPGAPTFDAVWVADGGGFQLVTKDLPQPIRVLLHPFQQVAAPLGTVRSLEGILVARPTRRLDADGIATLVAVAQAVDAAAPAPRTPRAGQVPRPARPPRPQPASPGAARSGQPVRVPPDTSPRPMPAVPVPPPATATPPAAVAPVLAASLPAPVESWAVTGPAAPQAPSSAEVLQAYEPLARGPATLPSPAEVPGTYEPPASTTSVALPSYEPPAWSPADGIGITPYAMPKPYEITELPPAFELGGTTSERP